MNFHFIPFDLTWSHLVNLCMYHCSDDYNPIHHIDTYGMWLWYVHAISRFVFSLSSYSHCFWFSPVWKSEHYHLRFIFSKRYQICKYNPITSAPYRIGSLTDMNLTAKNNNNQTSANRLWPSLENWAWYFKRQRPVSASPGFVVNYFKHRSRRAVATRCAIHCAGRRDLWSAKANF